MRILVAFALDNEFAAWRKSVGFRRVPTSCGKAFEALVGDAEVRVVLTGAGTRRAASVMESAACHSIDTCIASGLAGGLKTTHRPGEILAARTVAEIGATRVLWSDAKLLSAASRAGAKVVEKFLTAPRPVRSAREKQELGAIADAVDMESAAIMEAASRRGIPAIAIRAVCDPTDEELPLDFDRALGRQGFVSFPKLLGQLVARPYRLPRLMRLARECERATTNLCGFLDAYCRALAVAGNTAVEREEALAV